MIDVLKISSLGIRQVEEKVESNSVSPNQNQANRAYFCVRSAALTHVPLPHASKGFHAKLLKSANFFLLLYGLSLSLTAQRMAARSCICSSLSPNKPTSLLWSAFLHVFQGSWLPWATLESTWYMVCSSPQLAISLVRRWFLSLPLLPAATHVSRQQVVTLASSIF